MFDQALRSPLRFFVVAALLAVMLSLYPARGQEVRPAQVAVQEEAPPEQPVDADLSERTGAGCSLHRTLYYAPCGHSVQSRERLPAQFLGLSRAALESALPDAIPGAAVTGFSADEVDITLSVEIPCPLHWVLRTGEDGMLHILQNRDGETLAQVRRTDVQAKLLGRQDQAALLEGRIFDDVQALEGYLESISS